MKTIKVSTSRREEMVDITSEIRGLVSKNQWRDGVLYLYCPHTTAAVTINESADPSVSRDIISSLSRLIPHRGDYHHVEGNSDAHIKSSLIGCSEVVFVEDGSLVLGTWQGIFFTEFDGPRNRKLYVKFIPA